MPSQDLLNYINAEIARGTDKLTITNNLLLKGFTQQQIDEALSVVSPAGALPPQPPVPSFTYPQQTPTTATESETQAKPKGKMKIVMLIVIPLLLLLILSTSLITLFAYNALPIKNYALQNQIADILMQMPFMPKTPRFVLMSSANAHLKVTRVSFDLSVAADSNSLSALLGTDKIDAEINGKIDYTDLKNPLSDLNIQITKQFNLDFRSKDQILYFKVNAIPTMVAVLLNNFGLSESIQKQILGKWIYVDTKPLATDARKNLDNNNTDEKTAIQQQTKNYFDAFNNPEVLSSLTMTDDKLNGADTYHIHFAPNDKVLDIFWDEYTQSVSKQSSPASSKTKISDSIKNFVVDIFIDKHTYFTQKSTVRLTVKSAGYGSAVSANPLGMVVGQQDIPVSASVILSKFNEPVTVDAPKDAVKFDDLMKSLMPQMQSQALKNQTNNFSGANDTRRRSDVTQILNAIAAYAADHQGKLPSSLPTKGGLAKEISSTGANLCSELVPNYIPSLPEDPKINNGLAITKCTGFYDSGFEVSVGTSSRITISAPRAETGPISNTR